MTEAVASILVAVAFVNFVGHWLPWRVVPGAVDAAGRPRRLLSYAYGVGTILGGTAIFWPMVPVWYLVAEVVAAGVGTIISYVLDLVLEKRALAGDVEDLDTLMRESIS